MESEGSGARMKAISLACAVWIVGVICVPGSTWAQSTTSGSSLQVSTLPPTIPLFPLQDVVLFPNITRPLHIFEPRYRMMVADALKGGRLIGMVLLRPGYEAEYEGRPPVYSIGCAGVITDVEELPDGRYNIILRGLVKFRLTSEDQSQPYRVGYVEAIPEMLDDQERAALGERRQQLGAVFASIAPSAEPPPPVLPDEDLVNGLAQVMDLDPLDRQELLERKGPLARAQALIALLDRTAVLPR